MQWRKQYEQKIIAHVSNKSFPSLVVAAISPGTAKNFKIVQKDFPWRWPLGFPGDDSELLTSLPIESSYNASHMGKPRVSHATST